MSITPEQVQHVATLAQLAVPVDDVPAVAAKLSNVLDLLDGMASVDTQGVEPLTNPLDRVQTLRADTVTETNQREHLMQNAPATQDGLFLVPKVID